MVIGVGMGVEDLALGRSYLKMTIAMISRVTERQHKVHKTPGINHNAPVDKCACVCVCVGRIKYVN